MTKAALLTIVLLAASGCASRRTVTCTIGQFTGDRLCVNRHTGRIVSYTVDDSKRGNSGAEFGARR
jgi:hypothetical protein